MLAILPSNLTFSNSVILCHRMEPVTAVFEQKGKLDWIGAQCVTSGLNLTENRRFEFAVAAAAGAVD